MGTHQITSVEQLRGLYRQPSTLVQNKKGDRIEGSAAAFVARSSFVCLATADADGHCDVSPRGGPKGHLKILDDGRTVALPDLSGNNLIDSLTNIVENPHAGLLVMVTGSDETMRIDGRARLSTDPDVLALWADEVRTPKLAILLEVDAAFLHCAKAFRRGGVWDPETWPDLAPTAAPEVFNDLAGTSNDPAEMRAMLEAGYRQSLVEEASGGDE